jgi:two-component system, NarL family, nitrate/nitrite response regulator NarL
LGKPRSVVCDVHPVLLDALEALLKRSGFEVAGRGMRPADAVALVEEHAPDVLVVARVGAPPRPAIDGSERAASREGPPMSAAAVDDGHRAHVLIAADRLPTRIGLRLALEADADCTEADDADSAVAAAVRDRPDVCVLALEPPGQGLRTVNEIISRVPSAAVIFLTDRVDEEEFFAAVRAGASGYLPEGVDPSRLPFVVRGVIRGEPAVPRRFVSRLIDEFRGRERRHLMLGEQQSVELTSRESQVVELLRQRLPTREIAAQLGISPVTVRRHLSAVRQKLGVSSRGELLRLLD